MALDEEVLEEIECRVRCGFDDRDRIVEILCEEIYEPGQLDRSEVEAATDSAIMAHDLEKETWPNPTDCEKLSAVFHKLSAQGIVALENAGYTQSDGYDDFIEAYSNHTKRSSIVGYCFYHGQDMERAVRGGGLSLAFGPASPRNEESEGPKVGTLIVKELKNAGLRVSWDGTFKNRIHIPDFDWKRR